MKLIVNVLLLLLISPFLFVGAQVLPKCASTCSTNCLACTDTACTLCKVGHVTNPLDAK